MTRAGARLPGDTQDGDRDFGPLGGLPDEVHHFVRSRERLADAEGDRLLRAARGGGAGSWRSWRAVRRLRVAVARVVRRDPRIHDGT